MRRRLVLVLIFAGLLSTYAIARSDKTAAEKKTAAFTNPLPILMADPCVLKDNGMYYMYGTSAVRSGFRAFTSKDLVHWTTATLCNLKTKTSWAQRDFWAPEAVKKDGLYYLFYTSQNKPGPTRNACVAQSTSPLGPFHEIKAPLIPQFSCLDCHPFRDPKTGKWYLFVASEGRYPNDMWVGRLNDSLTELETTLTKCFGPDQAWERGWVEAPCLATHDGKYYMMYSGCSFNDARYAIGCAVADNPMGPWKKYDENPILKQSDTVSAPGHNCIVTAPDGKTLVAVYHRHLTRESKSRILCLDVINFEGPDSKLVLPEAPSSRPIKLPWLNPPSKPVRIPKEVECCEEGASWDCYVAFSEMPSL